LHNNAAKIAKGVCIIKDEFYYANEYNVISEYKHFPAEVYTFTKEVTDVGKEIADTGAEVTTLQTSDRKKRTRKTVDNSTVNKFMNSVKGVAATSAVVAVAALGVIPASTQPKVALQEFAVGGTYVEYQISIDELQDNLDYFIIISTPKESDRTFEVEENGVYQNRVEGLTPACEYSLAFVGYNEYLGKTTYFEEKFQTTAALDYEMGISNVSASSLNEVRIDFWHTALDDTCTAELLLDYGNGEPQERLPITKFDLSRGFVTVPVSETTTFLSVKPIVRYGAEEQSAEFTPYEHAFDSALDVDVKVDSYNGNIVLYLKGITGNATHVNVVDTETSETVLQEELYNNYVQIPYNVGEAVVAQYTVFLTDSAGETSSRSVNTVVDTAIQRPESYTFNYKNPADVGITYNEDGTINVYIKTDFACEDENLYYQVTLGDKVFQTRDPILAVENLPNETYPLIYEVCYDKNGIRYVLSSTAVSGSVNEFYYDSVFSSSVENQYVFISINSYLLDDIDRNSIRLVSSTGEEIQVSESELVYNEEYDIYTYETEFATAFEFITIYAKCSPFVQNMAGIEDYAGSLSIEMQTTIYNNG